MEESIVYPNIGEILFEDRPETKGPTINLAIGPSCPVRCEGCYNHFGDTAQHGGLITADEVINFAEAASAEGVAQATVSGGDPLFHPEITVILAGLKELGLHVKLDTVGTALIDEAQIIFKGRGVSRRIEISDITQGVDFVSVPLDGACQDTVRHFRRGRSRLFQETRLVAAMLRDAGIKFGYNTVANQYNIEELDAIRQIAEEDHASEWQVFEYDPSGPNFSNQKDTLKLNMGQFDAATSKIKLTREDMKASFKNLDIRRSAYFLIDDAGYAWQPVGDGLRHVIGHIRNDRSIVLDALRHHIA